MSGYSSSSTHAASGAALPPVKLYHQLGLTALKTRARRILRRSALHWCVRPRAVDWVLKSCWEAVKQAVNITHRIDSADAEDKIPLDPPTVCKWVKMYVWIIDHVPMHTLDLRLFYSVAVSVCLVLSMSLIQNSHRMRTNHSVHLYYTQQSLP